MSVLVFLVGLLLVGGLLFLGASVLLGRGETQPPAELDRSPVELPDARPVLGDDVRALRISVAFRGYRMTEVDWLLDQLAQALDERDVALARVVGFPAGSGTAGSLTVGSSTADAEDTDPGGIPVTTPKDVSNTDEERSGA